ncbi:MAG: prepilin peptidase [Lentisphaeria bacterium]|nr:prepilin peptidase [Lentisphaeria bacterium]
MTSSQITAVCKFFGITGSTDDWWLRIGLYESWGIWVFWLFWAFLIGSCMGSFLNVCVLRIPRGESVSDQPSHCLGCGMLIRWYDNIPVFSYLYLRGKCRKCGMKIPPRYLLMELFTGLLYAGALASAGWNSQPPEVLAVNIPLLSLALVTFQIDWKCRLIPDQTTYPAMVVGLLVSALLPGAFARESWMAGLLYSGLGLAGMGIGLALFAVVGEKIAKQEVFGWGDVKYMMAAGALAGLPGAVFILTTGSIFGVLFGLYVAILRYRRGRPWRGVRIPLGPCLAAASALWVFAGEKLLRLWLFGGM